MIKRLVEWLFYIVSFLSIDLLIYKRYNQIFNEYFDYILLVTIAFVVYSFTSGYLLKKLDKRLATKKDGRMSNELWVYSAWLAIYIVVPIYTICINVFVPEYNILVNLITCLIGWIMGLMIYQSKQPICYIFHFASVVGFVIVGIESAVVEHNIIYLGISILFILFYRIFRNY